jgi:PAS domain S-box-containing protein
MRKNKLAEESLTKENNSLRKQLEALAARCAESEEALEAIRHGEVDALVIYPDEGEKIYTIQGAETTYRLMVESINEGAATIIEDGTILYCNHRFADMLATPLEAIIGTSILKYIPSENQASFSSLLQRGLIESCRDEFILLQNGGTSIPVMISINNFSAGGSPGVCLIASDQTEPKKAEEQIRRDALVSETLAEFSRSLVEANLDEQVIMKAALQAAVLLIGDMCVTLLLSPDRQSLKMADHYHPDPVGNQFLENISSTVSIRANEGLSGQVIQTGEALLLPSFKLSQLRPIVNSKLFVIAKKFKISSLIVVPIRTREKTIGALLLGRLQIGRPYGRMELNLAERIANLAALAMTNARLYKDLENLLVKEQTMRLQLIQSEKLSAMSRMMATVVHEINNPVQTIKNCLYLAKLDTTVGSACDESLNIASSEIDRISKLVSNLRDIYHQPTDLIMKPVDVNKLLADVHVLLASHLQHQNVIWQGALPINVYWTRGIADHLKQVFLNLSMNAIEAMQPAGGTITITVIADPSMNELVVSLTDNGPGIEPENLTKIFEPFFTTKQKGNGLGLSICYEIIQSHSGRIIVESSPGNGATFTVRLPLIAPPLI